MQMTEKLARLSQTIPLSKLCEYYHHVFSVFLFFVFPVLKPLFEPFQAQIHFLHRLFFNFFLFFLLLSVLEQVFEPHLFIFAKIVLFFFSLFSMKSFGFLFIKMSHCIYFFPRIFSLFLLMSHTF